MINLFLWNCRGTRNDCFKQVFKRYMEVHRPNVVALLEPSGASADDAVKSLGFARSHRVEAYGFRGGIWILWQEDVEIKIIVSLFQFVHLQVINLQRQKVYISIVYASPSYRTRRHLWDQLASIQSTINHDPWIVGGDFNALLTKEDKKRGPSETYRIDKNFSSWFQLSGLSDLGFKSPQYTWARGTTLERLDRAFENQEWMEHFSDYAALHLPKFYSDHMPLLIKTHPSTRRNNGAPFKFLNAWVTDHSFKDMVKKSWGQSRNIHESIKAFTTKASIWNRQTFGHIGSKKKKLEAKILNIQQKLESSTNHHLILVKESLRREYEEVLSQEEIFWQQKSRCD